MPKKLKPKADTDPSNTVQISGDPANLTRLTAEIAVSPSLQAASTIKRWSTVVGDIDITSLINELRQQAATASSGDLKRQEAMLAIQAHTLDTIFNGLARRANAAEYLPQFEAYLRLALKAQSQCRATIETLAEMKNPKPVAFVQQANIANGPQQVNNAPQMPVPRAEETKVQPNKLLEQTHGERLDFGTAGQAVGSDPAMAAVGTIDRAANAQR